MAANRSTTPALMGIHRARSRRQDAIERRRKIHDQIQALLTDGLHASEEIEQRGEDVVEAGRQACSELCGQMHMSLPIELRDMIYDCIIGMPGDREHIFCLNRLTRHGEMFHNGITYDNPRMKNEVKSRRLSLRWWCSGYMGRTVALEIVQRWYKTREFILPGFSNDVSKFFDGNPFGKKIQPSAFIKHMTFEIWSKQSMSFSNQAANKYLPRLVELGNKSATVTFRARLDWLNSGAELMSEISDYLDVVTRTFRDLQALGLRNVIFQTKNPDYDLTHLIGEPESVIKQALVRLLEQ